MYLTFDMEAAMIDGASIFKLSDRISFRSLGAGEGAVVLTFQSGQLHTCNDTAAEFLSLLDGQCTFDKAVEKMSEKFDVSRELLRDDLSHLVAELKAGGVIG